MGSENPYQFVGMRLRLPELRADKPGKYKVNKVWKIVKKKMPIEFSFEKAYQLFRQASEPLSLITYLSDLVH